MSTSIITSKGQTTIPKEIREFLGLQPSDRLIYIIEGDEVKIQAARKKIDQLYGSFPHTGKKPIDFEKQRKRFQDGVAKRVVESLKNER